MWWRVSRYLCGTYANETKRYKSDGAKAPTSVLHSSPSDYDSVVCVRHRLVSDTEADAETHFERLCVAQVAAVLQSVAGFVDVHFSAQIVCIGDARQSGRWPAPEKVPVIRRRSRLALCEWSENV
jgi:hypothetical protein